MERETPVDTRKSLEIVDVLKKAGIGFIPIPVIDEDDRRALIVELQERLTNLGK